MNFIDIASVSDELRTTDRLCSHVSLNKLYNNDNNNYELNVFFLNKKLSKNKSR
jgi:hypothetical protein